MARVYALQSLYPSLGVGFSDARYFLNSLFSFSFSPSQVFLCVPPLGCLVPPLSHTNTLSSSLDTEKNTPTTEQP